MSLNSKLSEISEKKQSQSLKCNQWRVDKEVLVNISARGTTA
jgi:hypothetical protein